MKINNKFTWIIVITAVFLTACMLPEKTDPFSKIPEEKTETLYGEIFPFSVSVSTRATHRLEDDNKLVSLLASDIVQLREFEGRKVEVDGVYRKEKMRPIFWVESIRVKDLGENSAKSTSRFESENYSFVIPKNWESSILEDGTVHFLDKKDTNRKVFLTFAVKDITASDKNNDPNIVIANMAGNKTSSTFDSGQIRQEITLFSNIFDKKKYVFVFNNNKEDFSRKKDFFKLLNSFIEGKENVHLAHKEELKKLAAEELKLVQKDEATETDNEGPEKTEKTTDKNIISRIFGSDNKENSEEQTIDSVAEETDEEIVLSTEYENKINGNAFYYESSHYKFSMKVPYGLWFRNFGPSEKYVTQIGFAEHEVNSKNDSQFFLNMVSDESPVTSFQESQENDQLLIQFPRNNASYYELSGSIIYRDYMRSIQSTIESW